MIYMVTEMICQNLSGSKICRSLKWFLVFLPLFFGGELYAQPNRLCDSMRSICVGPDGFTFTGHFDVDIPTLDNYGCFNAEPNPTWFCFTIDNPGAMDITVEAGNDVDAIIYGPFTTQISAQSYCGFMGVNIDAPIVDCDDVSGPAELELSLLQTGELYVLLVTNYANFTQEITIDQTQGPATTDCTLETGYVQNSDLNEGWPLSVYPTVGSGFFSLEGLSENAELTVYDINGREVYFSQLEKETTHLMLDLQVGSYILEIRSTESMVDIYRQTIFIASEY
jgi:hypothetical protein